MVGDGSGSAPAFPHGPLPPPILLGSFSKPASVCSTLNPYPSFELPASKKVRKIPDVIHSQQTRWAVSPLSIRRKIAMICSGECFSLLESGFLSGSPDSHLQWPSFAMSGHAPSFWDSVS